MGRVTAAVSSAVVVSCEHASNRIPVAYRDLGLSKRALQGHIAWDLGAREATRGFAKVLRCSWHEGRWSRLLVDLNRSVIHEALIAPKSFGTRIPGNVNLDEVEKQARVSRYWQPYRDAVAASVSRAIAARGFCVHLSVHSFTPVVGGRHRRVDLGLLFDPSRKGESTLAADWRLRLRDEKFLARRNYPYKGTSDALVTALRSRLPGARYVGIELEINQRYLADRRAFLHMLEVTQQTFLASLEADLTRRGRQL